MDQVRISHLHTYFLFPFAVNSERVIARNPQFWRKAVHWLDGFEEWIKICSGHESRVPRLLGRWQRHSYDRFELDSEAYQDMVFFHPFVRHVFFDTQTKKAGPNLALIRCYALPLEGKQVFLEANDEQGRPLAVQVTELRLFIFANGMGILSVGVQATDVALDEALWINEQMRKVYPSSGRQIREGRAPSEFRLTLRGPAGPQVVAGDNFQGATMIGFEPPLSALVQALLYFMDYQKQEYEQVVDERMIVYSYVELDAESAREMASGEDYEVLFSRFLYVDRAGRGYRYQRDFIRKEMDRQVYRRWAHEGTYYGFTSYSNISLCVGKSDRGGHQLREGFLIHRMFNTRYYLMTVVALFYRATLLMFNEKTALISKRLYHEQTRSHEKKRENVELALKLRAEFLHFSNYWYFSELANKDEESQHFEMQCREYRIAEMMTELERELEAMSISTTEFFQARNTAAVNRVAMLSLIFGAGAIVTGYFGMNFGERFGAIFFAPGTRLEFFVHGLAVGVVTAYAVGALIFGLYVITANWRDYGHILNPRRPPAKTSADALLQAALAPDESTALAEATSEATVNPQPIEPIQQTEKG